MGNGNGMRCYKLPNNGRKMIMTDDKLSNDKGESNENCMFTTLIIGNDKGYSNAILL